MDIQTLFGMLKTKYPQSGLSDNEIKGLATSLFATGLVTDENAQTIVDGQADAMKGFQSLFDSRFSAQREAFKKTIEGDAEKAFRAKYNIGEDGLQTTKQKEETDEQQTAFFKKMLDEALKPILDRQSAEDDKRNAEKRMNEVVEAAKRNGVPEELARLLNVPTDVDLDSFMKDKSQTFTNLGFQKAPLPGGGRGSLSEGETFASQIRAGAPKKEEK